VFLSTASSIRGAVQTAGFFYYCAAWVLNLSWSQIFFRLQRPDLSFAVILGMLAFIALTIRAFYPVSRLAAYLLVPYLVWVSFATYLNGYIVFMNPVSVTKS
jgi:tryptophan-rich sensory protein